VPAIVVHSLELTDAQKEILCERFVAAFSEVSRVPPDRIYVFFNGYPLDAVGTGAGLFSKSPPKQAIGKFNQPES